MEGLEGERQSFKTTRKATCFLFIEEAVLKKIELICKSSCMVPVLCLLSIIILHMDKGNTVYTKAIPIAVECFYEAFIDITSGLDSATEW